MCNITYFSNVGYLVGQVTVCDPGSYCCPLLGTGRPPTRPPSPPQPASAPQQAPHPPTHHPKCTIGLANLPLGLSGRTLKFRFLRLHGPNFYGPLKHHRNSPGFSGTVAVPWGWWHLEAGLQLDESFRVTHIPSLA